MKKSVFQIFLALCLFNSCSGQADSTSLEIDEPENMDGMTLDEYFASEDKFTAFEEAEKLDSIQPWYSLRMGEVRVSKSNDGGCDWEPINSNTFSRVDREPNGRDILTNEISAKIESVLNKLSAVLDLKKQYTAKEIYEYMISTWTFSVSFEQDFLLAILDLEGIFVQFGCEQGDPVGYKEIIEQYAHQSKGLFNPGHFFQQNDENDVVEYVQFTFNEKIYRFFPMDMEGYVDDQLVNSAINLALSEKGVEERFYNIELGGCSSFFLKPADMLKLASAFNLGIK